MAEKTSDLSRLNPFRPLTNREDAVWSVRYGALALGWMALAITAKGALMLAHGGPAADGTEGSPGWGPAGAMIVAPLLIAAPLCLFLWRRQSRTAAVVALLAELIGAFIAAAAVASGQGLEGVLAFDLIAAAFGAMALRSAVWLSRQTPAATPAISPGSRPASVSASPSASGPAAAAGQTRTSYHAREPASEPSSEIHARRGPPLIDLAIALVALMLAGLVFALFRAAQGPSPDPATSTTTPAATLPATPAAAPAPRPALPLPAATPPAAVTAPVPLFANARWSDLGVAGEARFSVAIPAGQSGRPLVWIRHDGGGQSGVRDESGRRVAYATALDLFQFDCRRSRARLVDARYYLRPGLQDLIATPPAAAPWAPSQPGGFLAATLARACS